MLKMSVSTYSSYDETLEGYNYQLGDEAKSLLKMMFEEKERV